LRESPPYWKPEQKWVKKKSILFLFWKQAQQWMEKKAYYNGHEYWKQAQQRVEKKSIL
jgi:hypothetical protein